MSHRSNSCQSFSPRTNLLRMASRKFQRWRRMDGGGLAGFLVPVRTQEKTNSLPSLPPFTWNLTNQPFIPCQVPLSRKISSNFFFLSLPLSTPFSPALFFVVLESSLYQEKLLLLSCQGLTRPRAVRRWKRSSNPPTPPMFWRHLLLLLLLCIGGFSGEKEKGLENVLPAKATSISPFLLPRRAFQWRNLLLLV